MKCGVTFARSGFALPKIMGNSSTSFISARNARMGTAQMPARPSAPNPPIHHWFTGSCAFWTKEGGNICPKHWSRDQDFAHGSTFAAKMAKCPHCGRKNVASNRGLTQHMAATPKCCSKMRVALGLSVACILTFRLLYPGSLIGSITSGSTTLQDSIQRDRCCDRIIESHRRLTDHGKAL